MSKKIIKSAAERGDRHTGWQSGDGSPVLNKRVRPVWPTGEVPHKWAHQTQESARNPQGNLFFEGPTIYSYRTFWPLARIYSRKKPVYVQHGSADDRPMRTEARDTLVLTNNERYSVTTGQHQHAVNHACGHLPRIEVPRVLVDSMKDHNENLAYFAAEQARLLKEAERATRETNVTWRASRAGELHKAMAVAIRAVKEFGRLGYNVALASRNDSDYARAEIVAPLRPYQPKTGERCACKPGAHRDNCPDCEGTGWRIDFAAIRARRD